jgi:hypothetical protein
MTTEAYDLKALIRHEHRQAELQRLQMGLDGCGCSECQALYTEIDLEKYGARVINSGGTIVVMAGKTGADILKDDGINETGAMVCSGEQRPAMALRYFMRNNHVPDRPADNIPIGNVLSPSNFAQADDSSVSKIKDDTFIVPQIVQTRESRIMKQRGRPRKSGEVSRTTAWRREKEKVFQGTLI